MMTKFLVMIVVALGTSYCKTRVNTPAPVSPSAGNQSSDGSTNPLEKFVPTTYLLTEGPTVSDLSRLKLKSVEVSPYYVNGNDGHQTATGYEVTIDPLTDDTNNASDYRVISLCYDNDGKTGCFERRTCSLDSIIDVPATHNGVEVKGKISITARGCAGANRLTIKGSGTEADFEASCGPWSTESRFVLNRANSGPNLTTLLNIVENQKAQQNIVEEYLKPYAQTYYDEYVKKVKAGGFTPSNEQKQLYVVASNIVKVPHLMCAVYSTAMFEQFTEMAASGSTGLNLSQNPPVDAGLDTSGLDGSQGSTSSGSYYQKKEKVPSITNSLQCVAAGEEYEWVNSERACYRVSKKESRYREVLLSKKWFNDQSIAGGMLMFATLAAGSIFYAADSWAKQHSQLYRFANDTKYPSEMLAVFSANQTKLEANLQALRIQHGAKLKGNVMDYFWVDSKNKTIQASNRLIEEMRAETSFKKWQPIDEKNLFNAKGGMKDVEVNTKISSGDTLIRNSKSLMKAGLAVGFASGFILWATGYSRYSDESQYQLTGSTGSEKNLANGIGIAEGALAKLKKEECELKKDSDDPCPSDSRESAQN